MTSPQTPNKYVGPGVYIANYVIRNRRPTTADYRQPETGRLYPIFAGWQVGKDPINGSEGELWFLSKIVANLATWILMDNAVGDMQGLRGDDGVEVDPAGDGYIDLIGLTVPNATNAQPVFTTSLNPNEETIEVQLAAAVAPTPGDALDAGLASFNNTQFTVDANGFVSLAGGGLAIDSVAVQATSGAGTNPVVPTGAGQITLQGAIVAAGTNPMRSVSTAANTIQIQTQYSQAIGATNATNVGLAAFDSAMFTVDANGFVSLSGGGLAVDAIGVESISGTGTDPVLPAANGVIEFFGAIVPAGTDPVSVNSAVVNSVVVDVQLSQALAATDATKVGLCNFNSASFTVDANGFVSLTGGGAALDSLGVEATTGGGVDPVVGDVNGKIEIVGQVAAAGVNPVRSVSPASNTLEIQVQTSQAIAATDATKIGLCNFDSAMFTVDANGFVSLAGGGAALDSLTGDTGAAATPTAGNINLRGIDGAAYGIETASSGSQVAFNVFRWEQPTNSNWTPVIIGKTVAGAATYAVQHGVYGRIGNVVFFTFQIRWTAHTGSGEMRVTGLPYIFAKANTVYCSSMVCENILMPANTIDVNFSGVNSETYGDVIATIDNAPRAGVDLPAVGTIVTYGFYFTNS